MCLNLKITSHILCSTAALKERLKFNVMHAALQAKILYTLSPEGLEDVGRKLAVVLGTLRARLLAPGHLQDDFLVLQVNWFRATSYRDDFQ